MKKKTRLLLAISAILLMVMLLGVSYTQNKQITLTFGMFADSNWDVPNADGYKIIDDVIKRFEKKYPNVKVKYVSGLQRNYYSEWLSQKALQDELPDVYMVCSDDLSNFASIGMLQNLESFMRTDSNFKKSAYFTPSLQAGAFMDQQYALPYESVPTLMYVNKTLLEKEKIKMPKENWTWDDFLRISKQVTKDVNGDGLPDQFGVFGYTWQNAVASNNGTVFSEDGLSASLNNSNVYDAIEFTRKLEKINQGQTPTSEMFDKGLVAFCPMRFSEYRTYKPYPWRVKKYANFEWDCIPMPSGPQGDNVSELDTLSMGMSKTSSHKKLAWEFMKMLCYDKETQKDIFAYSQGVSVLKDITNSDTVIKYLSEDTPGESSFNLSFFNNTMEHAIAIRKFSDYDQVISVADSEIRRLLSTEEDIKSTVDTLQSKLDLLLKR